MRSVFVFLLMIPLVYGQQFNAMSEFGLAPPQLWASSQLFTDSVQVQLQLDYPDVQIRYRTDGQEVTESDALYNGPLTLTQSSQIMAKAFHPELQSSDYVSMTVDKIRYDIRTAIIQTSERPHESYKGLGPSGLVDLKRGSTAFRGNSAWMGFQTDSLQLILRLKSPLEIEEVKVGFLEDQGSWIFGPSHIVVFHKGDAVGAVLYKEAASSQAKEVALISIPIEKGTYTELSILIQPLASIPDWHDGAGTTPWLFLDEILIN
ncbi:chitobiase/beta-hexosaminidase C-terminal domain-containing protein [Sediminicola luteus]|uniref:GH29D-like beta-sandwich domain-containing protein n=1 Tax=Sediminicola luteus TaxID=319238 RepID=A0A2A4GER4_9FLAO|nr:chitobiase/beta-hexosaminidase C-terminal domain-containing protein [Sediminicola luteus]PCE66498.1 hypothetical protein B7P33_04165 [Sediminicola luteus]